MTSLTWPYSCAPVWWVTYRRDDHYLIPLMTAYLSWEGGREGERVREREKEKKRGREREKEREGERRRKRKRERNSLIYRYTLIPFSKFLIQSGYYIQRADRPGYG